MPEEAQTKTLAPQDERDIVGREPFTISDEQIREILYRFVPILYKGITEARTFRSAESGGDLTSAVEMTSEEFELWERYYQIVERAKKTSLALPVFPDNEASSPILPNSPKNNATSLAHWFGQDQPAERIYRVNLGVNGSPLFIPIEPFKIKHEDDLHPFIKPSISINSSGGSLYNSIIGLDTYFKDKEGRFAIDAIAGTEHSFDPRYKGPVYGVYDAASVSLWFNVNIRPEKPNHLKVNFSNPESTMLSCDINQPELLRELSIPSDERLRFFFWQLDKFMKGDNGRTPLRLGGGG